jgi:hypothetical protein
VTSGLIGNHGVPARRSFELYLPDDDLQVARAGTPAVWFAPLVTPYEELTTSLSFSRASQVGEAEFLGV